MDAGQLPPFFHIEQPFKMGGEGLEKSGLPVEMLREIVNHGAQATPAILEPQQFVHEKLRAPGVKFVILTGHSFRFRPAKLLKGERLPQAQLVADGFQSRQPDLVGDETRLRPEQEDGQVVGLQMRAQAGDQPEGDIGRLGAGAAVGRFHEEGLDNGAKEEPGFDGRGEGQAIVPPFRIILADQDRALAFLRGGVDDQSDAAPPLVSPAQCHQIRFLDPLAGNHQQGRVQGEFGIAVRLEGGIDDESVRRAQRLRNVQPLRSHGQELARGAAGREDLRPRLGVSPAQRQPATDCHEPSSPHFKAMVEQEGVAGEIILAVGDGFGVRELAPAFKSGGKPPHSTAFGRGLALPAAGATLPPKVSTTHTPRERLPLSRASGEDAPGPVFVTTHWSVVLNAGRGDSARAGPALARLCQTYWYPLYAYARRRGYRAHDAQDLTQDFFARLLDGRLLARADPGRGRFRSFLLASMNNFLANEWEKARAGKRGGGRPALSLDLAAAEQRYDLEPVDDATPDKAFDKQWALRLLEAVLTRLEQEYRREGKAALFALLKTSLTGARESQPYAELAASMGMSEGAIKVAVHRLRRRYRDLIREEIAQTVASPEEVDSEMRHLLEALGGS